MQINDLKNLPVYISGPITGREHPGIPFMHGENLLIKLGFKECLIFNPFYHCWFYDETRWTHCMAMVLEHMPHEGILCRLPGWRGSPGARIENYYAKIHKLVICDIVGNTLKLADDYFDTGTPE